MKTNTDTILFEGIVRDAYKVSYTYPPSEVVEVEYKLPPEEACEVYDVDYDPETETVSRNFREMHDTGWTHVDLPNYFGLKPGDKIRIIKV